MAHTILIKRGLSAGLGTVTPQLGELLWTTDTKVLYMGDGTQVGGTDVLTDVKADISTINTSLTGLTTDAVSEGTNLYYTDTRADSRIQTAISDTTTSTTTLWSSDKINSVLTSGASYNGLWQADGFAGVGTPALANGTGQNGDFYIVEIGGDASFDGGITTITFLAGDRIIYEATSNTWLRVVTADAIDSVNSQTGVVTLGGADIIATGYIKPVSTAALVSTDDINTALGKLEKGLEDAAFGLGDVNVQSDWNETNNILDSFILNKPADLTNLSTHSIDELQDIDTSTVVPVINDYLSWDGVNWTPSAQSTIAIDDLTDVDTVTTTPLSNDILSFDGTNWIPVAPAASGSTSLLGLTDTPAAYLGTAGFTLQINATADAIEFVDNSIVDGGAF